ncbi:MAG: hypothetical protein EOP48_02825, partial [Sphingobacteriales bacterium]
MLSIESLLYIGSLDCNSNSYRRFEALSNLSTGIRGINTEPYIMAKYLSGIQHYHNIGVGIYLLNRKIRAQVKKRFFDIVWVDNKNYLSIKTMEYIKLVSPNTRIVNMLTDDPFGVYKNSWKLLRQTAALYDYFFVQREENVDELKALGARHVGICYRSYAPDFNRPLQLSKADAQYYGAGVGFIGSYEADRAASIAFLIKNGITVQVTG